MQKGLVWSETNDFRPFCSERCRLIDLGAWATGRNKIKGSNLMEKIGYRRGYKTLIDQNFLIPETP
ncbi:MAG: hypothetical protein Ct9H90mP4_11760 [Gammaproteobacteria bacterium]|nr:MAG: hypothetical protein Ct9H90mP4_11760 [Gammaproteobacteria bacterium]